MEPWAMGAGLRPVGKPPDRPPDPNAVARHRSIPTVAADKATVLRVQVPPYQFVRFGYVAMPRFMENQDRSRIKAGNPMFIAWCKRPGCSGNCPSGRCNRGA